MQQLDPQTLALLTAQLGNMRGGQRDSYGTLQWGGVDGSALDDWNIQNYLQSIASGPGVTGLENPMGYREFTTFSRPVEGNGDLIDVYDQSGKWLSREAGTDSAAEMNTAIALMAAGYFGGGALGEAAGAGAGAGGGMTASQQAAMMAANGMTDAEIAAALGSQGAQAAGLSGVGGGAAAGAGASGLTSSQLASGAKTLSDVMGGGQGAAALLGGVVGALDSKDKEQTSSRDPWAPMQPYLLGLAKDGADLYAKYKAQPFSQAQQTAYANQGSLLDSLNQATPGLLQAMQMTAGGQNQFVRGRQQNPVATYGWSGLNWQPGLLGNFGTKG